jgi:nicotinamidase-related amidase
MDHRQLALLLIDIQRDFWQPLAAEPRFAAFPANIRALLDTARSHRLLVVHTHAAFRPDRSDWLPFYGPHGRGPVPCIAGTGGATVEPFAMPVAGEHIILKQAFDGFVNTDLERVLREHHIRAVLVAGLVTSVCVLFTATAAYLRRFVPIVVSDACADSVEEHETCLATYRGLCFQTVTTGEVRDDLPAVLRLAEGYTG